MVSQSATVTLDKWFRMWYNRSMDTIQREAKNKYQREWCARNREKVRKTNRESFKRRYVPHPRPRIETSYYERHKEEVKASNKLRRDALRAERAAFLVWLRERSCCIGCGLTDSRVFEFDHVPERGERRFGVTDGKCTGASEAVFFGELAKCDIVCANCHKTRTWLRRV